MLRWRKLHRWTLSILILLSPELSFEQTTMVAVGPVGLAPRPSVFGRCFRRPRTRRGGRAVPFTVKVKQRNAARDAPDLQEDVEVMGVKDGVAVIAGSALGGGFLALPLVTAPLGILPSLVGLGMAWAFIAALCTVYAEVSAQTLTDKALEAVQSREDRPMLEQEGVSIVSVAQRRLGDSAAVVCSVAFLFQMLAVVTAQVAKSGELLESLMGLPYVGGCILPSIFLGLFTFEMPVKLVEQTNTILTALMVIGFALLVVNSCMTISFAELPELISNLPRENWKPLLPAAGTTTWALPIFFNLLCYGQSVPLVVERMGAQRSSKIRNTILLGSMIPLILGIIWVCVAALLGSRLNLDGAEDPVLQLVHGPWSIALPVLLLAAGAIGTTLIASYLALGQFAADALCAATGSCSLEDNPTGQSSLSYGTSSDRLYRPSALFATPLFCGCVSICAALWRFATSSLASFTLIKEASRSGSVGNCVGVGMMFCWKSE